jgi:hypothetical protein
LTTNNQSVMVLCVAGIADQVSMPLVEQHVAAERMNHANQTH